jgi:hypothetical protein
MPAKLELTASFLITEEPRLSSLYRPLGDISFFLYVMTLV